MNPRLQAFIESKKSELQQKQEAQKQEFLLTAGLFEKEYCPEGFYSNEYRFSEFDETQRRYRYYKPVPIDISDAEYEELVKFIKENKLENSPTYQSKSNRNGAATVLSVIAYVTYVLLGLCTLVFFVLGFSLGEVWFIVSPLSLVGGFIFGSVFLGFSEIIKLLTAIKNK